MWAGRLPEPPKGENRVASHEQVQKQGVVKRTVKYFKLHGLKQTIKKIFSKIAGK
jgi:hypothetical protein